SDPALPRRPQDSVPACPLRLWPDETFTHKSSAAFPNALRQAGGNSELEAEAPRVQRHRWKGWLPWVRLQAAIDGMADCAAAAAPLSSPAPAAHRCAAAGLDSGTAAAILASMPSTPQWIAGDRLGCTWDLPRISGLGCSDQPGHRFD